MKPINRAILFFIIASLVFWTVFSLSYGDAQNYAKTPALLVYGDWETEIGRTVNQNQVVYRENVEVNHLGNKKMDLNVCFLPEYDRPKRYNLRYETTKLFVSINTSEPIFFCLGYQIYSRAMNGSGYRLSSEFQHLDFSRFYRRRGFEASYVIINQHFEERLRPSEHHATHFWAYSQTFMTDIKVYLDEWFTPCIFWNGTQEGVKFTYAEVWRHQPVVDYDYSTSDFGTPSLFLIPFSSRKVHWFQHRNLMWTLQQSS